MATATLSTAFEAAWNSSGSEMGGATANHRNVWLKVKHHDACEWYSYLTLDFRIFVKLVPRPGVGMQDGATVIQGGGARL
jgi:hypothetical protein